MKTLRFFHTDDLNNPASYIEVYPLGKKEFEDKIEKKEVFYRRKLNGKYTFRNNRAEGILDFDLFIGFEKDAIERCKTRFIIAEELCNKVWSVIHKGKFSMNDGEFNLDKCELSIKTKEVDKYSCIKENKNTEFNILGVGPIIETIAPRSTPYEFLSCRSFDQPCGPATDCYAGPNPTKWSSFYEECTPVIPNTGVWNKVGKNSAPYETLVNQMKVSGNYAVWESEDNPPPNNRDIIGYDILADNRVYIYDNIVGLIIQGFDISNNLVVYAIPQGTNTLIREYDFTTAITTTLFTELNDSIVSIFYSGTDVITYSLGGKLRVNGTLITTTLNLTNIVAFGDYVVFYDTGANNLRLYKISTLVTITIYTDASINFVKIEGDFIVFKKSANEVIKRVISTATNSVISIDESTTIMVITDTHAAFEESTNELILYDLINDTFEILGGNVIDENRISINNDYLTWYDNNSNNVEYYDILTDTTTTIETINNVDWVCLSGDNVGYNESTNNLFKDYDILTDNQLFSNTTNTVNSLSCDNGYFALSQTGTAPFTSENDKAVVYYAAIPNLTRIKIWYREVRTTICVDGIPAAPSGSGWVLEQDDCAGNGTSFWVRNPSPPVINPTIQITNCVCDIIACEPDPPVGVGQWLLIGGCDLNDPRAFYWLLPGDITYKNGRLLKDVVEALVAKNCSDINGIVSNFFQWNPTTISNINYVTGLISEVNHITIHQKSDIKKPNATESATIGLLKWSDLVKTLRIMFEVYWFIDDNNVLHFEHISSIQENIGLDLTQGKYKKWQENNRQYSYSKSEMFMLEKYKMQEQENLDFVGFPIEYKDSNGDWSLCVNDQSKEYILNKFTTDLLLAQNNPDAIDNEGFYLIANSFDGVNYSILLSTGFLSNQLLINSSLGWANLQEAFLKWNRILREGNVNNIFQQMESYQRFKKQEKFKIPLCCEDNYNPVDFIKTDLGIAQVETGLRDFKNNTLELKLKYQ